MLVTFVPGGNPSLILLLELFLFLLLGIQKSFKINRNIFFAFSLLYLIIYFQTGLNFLIPLKINSLINGFIVVPFFLILVYLLTKILLSIDYYTIEKVFKYTIFFLVAMGWLSIIFPFSNILLGYGDYSHPMFPFSEPSHYAIAIFPLVAAYGISQKNSVKFFLLIILLIQALLLPNLTLMISVIFLIFLYWGLKRFKFAMIFIFIIGALSLFELLKIPYFATRLSGFGDQSMNLSVLVYIQGWQDMIKALTETNGLGLGYRMMGTNEPSSISEKIAWLGYPEISRTDGSFLASKLIAEFGMMGIIFLSYTFFYAYKFYKWIYITKKALDPKIIFLFALAVSILLELFIRGGDYFSSTVYLSFSAFIALQILYFNKKSCINVEKED